MMPSARFVDLEGASVLITGGGSGIGAALTEGFARQGAKVAFIDIAERPSLALADRIEKELGRRPLYLKADLRDIEALRASVAMAVEAHGDVTVLVNNAALDDRHAVEDVTVEFWDNNQAINLRPHFFTAQAVVPGMKRAGGGSIINFTSTSFLMNFPDMPAYTAAKAGIVGLTKGLAGNLGADRIRVNAVAPGWVITERQRELWVTEERIAAHVAKQCIKDVMQADDLVGTVLFLASDASRMLTAQTLIVDGGYL
ncbi:SDR family NAD(P)-dependent oxidoreductase [Mesorhizobium helmanticense]|uniref:3-oxoacyl-ACP reductase n=1 Tax=Mesorhizobium helmanticense TaxID=1776423 RepID=A0A2T4IMQ4_9HYPH|nr:SDR family oxidoreductase [Mesorhizobium helmanticense]PTE06880.1 3-oxoacyl-ACP reductase [Mesorhizobium helmanticense]